MWLWQQAESFRTKKSQRAVRSHVRSPPSYIDAGRRAAFDWLTRAPSSLWHDRRRGDHDDSLLRRVAFFAACRSRIPHTLGSATLSLSGSYETSRLWRMPGLTVSLRRAGVVGPPVNHLT